MDKILVTGGSGFFGQILLRYLTGEGYECINVDIVPSEFEHSSVIHYQEDIRNFSGLDRIAGQHKITAIIHCAAILGHGINSKKVLWSTNVEGTENIARLAKKYGIKKVVFTSSNCLWGNRFDRPIVEEDAPCPVELYGKTKLEGEKILLACGEWFDSVIIRCPTIIDSGRLGLLGILFQFIYENRKIWVVGKGNNFYQFIYAEDLADACLKSVHHKGTEIFNIGSDNVKSFNAVYSYVIEKAGSKSRIKSLPKKLTLFGMKVAFKLRLSPMGPYHYKMIAESFIFDTAKIKKVLGWKPSLTNEEMLYKAYCYYHENKNEIDGRKGVSPHRKVENMRIIHLLRWFS
ncbi:UDP-glucose 4-epimerase [Ruminiclostridium hungatei]|uniref:UDP-glucose 4-epimerase n=1 Tax=Ruminiclostridium hungatei TaxID=48256 RepID=A0A1V4SGE3_RUMHU|nr:NAD(P)-dependent oxidoreductase [Ruminiclostridium hungatei]OPX42959.1 UDP-glucose 4-epimerase [Ruminiclostridium hungatei]